MAECEHRDVDHHIAQPIEEEHHPDQEEDVIDPGHHVLGAEIEEREGRGDDWVQISQSLAEAGKLAEQAADTKDPDKVFEVGGTLYSVCSGCHQVYPPAEGLAPETAAEAPPS